MTRKTYRELADRIGKNLAFNGNANTETWELIGIFCDAMKSDNPRFDRQKFLDAIEAERVAMQEVWEMRKKGMAAR